MTPRLFVAVALALFAIPAACAPPPSQPPVITGLGRATAPLDGKWQFHIGDNPAWASPTFDDSKWEQVVTDRQWGNQGHFAYSGFAWYRRAVVIAPSPSNANLNLVISIPLVRDVYEVFWNGQLIGHFGTMTPHPDYPFDSSPHIFGLGPARSGVLAIRVWRAPPQSFAGGGVGGLTGTPVIGGEEAIVSRHAQSDHVWLRNHQYQHSLALIEILIAITAFLGWIQHRSRPILLWVALYFLVPFAFVILNLPGLPISFHAALGLQQPFYSLADVSLWFLLIYLLELDDHTRLMQWTRIVASLAMGCQVLDGVMVYLSLSGSSFIRGADGVLTAVEVILELYVFVVIGNVIAFGKRHNLAPWLVALFAITTTLINTVRIASEQGRRYTHWTISTTIVRPIFTINGNPFNIIAISGGLLILSIIFAVYRYLHEEGRRQAALASELKSCQELQRVLIPESLPSLPGYALSSAYRPAQEVGGDFFQVIPLPDSSALVILGDVSGKGLKAALTVSLIVGTVRTLAEMFADPAEILAGLNRRLDGRLQSGFVTCVAMLLDTRGGCIIACAGHPAPFLNQRELDLPAALPLGLVPSATFDNHTINLVIGDRLTLYTDGLLEARSRTGELFGFDRLSTLIATGPDARRASDAAVAFGQDDDITVLTVTRLGVGVEATVDLVAPTLASANA